MDRIVRRKSAQELQNALLRLVGERERGDRDRLAGRQRLAVGRLLVGVGQGQVGRPGLQHVDQVLREVLTDLHDREVGTERRGLRTQRGAAVFSAVSTLLVAALSMRSEPTVAEPRPRPFGLKVTPAIVEVDLPVSLNTSFSVSPLSRLTPLKDASCAVVVICWMIWLYWATRLARVFCELTSVTAALTAAVVPTVPEISTEVDEPAPGAA